MPVVNGKAVESAIRIGLALNCEIAEWCRFARKNYFYPDMPKNFQTSQYDEPIAFDGYMDVDVRRRDLPRRDRARAHGGGHRQVAARRRRHRPHPRRRLLAGRLQPRRHPPHRDRHPPDHRRGGEGTRGREGVRRPAARADRGARRLRGPDGPGQPARRRQPLAAPRRAAASSAPAPRPRTSTRSARSSGPCATRCSGTPAILERRRLDPAGDPALARGHRHHHQRSGEVRRRGLPLLPRARPGAGGAVPRVGRGAARDAAGEPDRRSAPGCRPTGASPTSRCATPSAPARSAWSRRPSRPAPRRRPPASGGSRELARRANEAGIDIADLGVTPADVARVQALVDEGTINDKLARQVFDGAARRRGHARRDRRGPRAGRSSPTTARSARRSTTRSRPTPTSPTRSATARSPPPAPSSAR